MSGCNVRVARTIRPAGTAFCFNPDLQTFRPLSDELEVRLNGRPVEVRACRESRVPFNRPWPGRQRPLNQTERASYIACEAAGPFTVEVEPKRPFARAVVRPLSAGIATQVAHRAVSFSVPGPGYYVLEIDGPHGALHLFVEPPRDFPEKKGATYRYGPGMHVAGLVRLKSHDRVYVDRDAIVFGCFIGEGVEDVDIFGHGVIDGRMCERVFEGCYSPLQPSCIRFHHSRGIRIDGPVLMDSPSWTLAFFDCENVETRHVKIIGQWRYNTDGIDICNSRRVTVRDSFVRSFDDTIAVKGVPPLRDRPVEDVTVERCVLWCGWGKTIETGIETWAPRFRNIRYADCDILRSQASALNVSAGGPAVVENVVFENIRVEMQADTQTAVLQTSDGQLYEEPHGKTFPALVAIDNARYGPGSEDPVGRVRNCTFRNVSVSAEPGVPRPTIRVHCRFPPGENPDATGHLVFERFSVNGNIGNWNDFDISANVPITTR